MRVSKHYASDRGNREQIIRLIGEGEVIASFKVNRGHVGGPEAHLITNTGIIRIYNFKTKRLITKLVARPNQIRRYYEGVGQQAPQWLVDLAYEHKKMGYHEV